jgi:endonuclease/exonuclease/phosphatase family metal-dependent hydrolase
VPPFLLLDHVLISQELSVTSVAELPAGHSDHRPVVADLALRL